MTQSNSPIETLRDGNIQATIWENQSEKGSFYSVTFSRSYKDADGNYQNSGSFSGIDLLKITQLTGHAYMLIKQHEREDWQERLAA